MPGQFVTKQSTSQTLTTRRENSLREKLRTGFLRQIRFLFSMDKIETPVSLAGMTEDHDIHKGLVLRDDLADHSFQQYLMSNISKAEGREQAQRDRFHKTMLPISGCAMDAPDNEREPLCPSTRNRMSFLRMS